MSYCPELNFTLLKQHVKCRIHGICDGLTASQLAMNINALRAASSVCAWTWDDRKDIERKYQWELILKDSTNDTHLNYFKNFLDLPSLDQQSFCMSGQPNLQYEETLRFFAGLCFMFHGQKDFYNEKK